MEKLEAALPAPSRVSVAILTKFEKARVLGVRALQISYNAPLMVDPGKEINPIKIAEMEFEQNKLPIQVVRNLPDGRREIWNLNDFQKA
jgi:DNA-directed RNA polymerase I, II, and III subunit RPABC2